MRFGTDTARYQALGTYDPGEFEVVNIEDPQFEAKTARNLAEGRPTGYYPWIYPGTDVHAFTTWAIAKARAAGSNFGAWADYEQDGVTLDLLDQFFAACDAAGEKAGYYGNDWRFGHDRFLARPFWLAGYPDPNDGQWRDGWAPQSRRSVQLWQFTSGAGLDRNVVIDEGWYAAWTSSTPPPPAPPKPKELPEMFIGVKRFDPLTGECEAFWVDGGVTIRDFGRDNPKPWGPYGLTLPQAAFDFAASVEGIHVEILNDLEWLLIDARTKHTTGLPNT